MSVLIYALNIVLVAVSYFLIELLVYFLLSPGEWFPLAFGGLWSLLLAMICLCLPRKTARIVFGISFYFYLAWALAQVGYYSVFGRMLWLQDIFYAGEGAAFFGDILGAFPALWWLGGIALIVLGAFMIWSFPKTMPNWLSRLVGINICLACLIGLMLLPQAVFMKDNGIWGTRSE